MSLLHLKQFGKITLLTVSMYVLQIAFSPLNGQESDSTYKAFDANIHLKNMHTWRGGVVTPGALFATSLEYTTRNQKFTLGLWGGASFNGTYTEYSYYAVYRFTDKFYTELVSHNNYSGQVSPNMFSYYKVTSPNFFDIAFGYTISEAIPLKIFVATILGGQAGDYDYEDNGDITDSYSTYLELKYDVWKKGDSKLSVHAGAAAGLGTEKTFYSEGANFVNIGLSLNKNVKLFSKDFPLEFTGFWNPETKQGVLQADILLF